MLPLRYKILWSEFPVFVQNVSDIFSKKRASQMDQWKEHWAYCSEVLRLNRAVVEIQARFQDFIGSTLKYAIMDHVVGKSFPILLLPPSSQQVFLLLTIGRFYQWLTPQPLKNAIILNGWSLMEDKFLKANKNQEWSEGWDENAQGTSVQLSLLTPIRFKQISPTRIFKKFPFLT